MPRESSKYNFKSIPMEGYTNIKFDSVSGVPRYSDASGFGFVSQTGAKPARDVHIAEITSDEQGVWIMEPVFFEEEGNEEDHYNHYGLAFRVKTPPGAYSIDILLTADASDALVSVSGMHSKRLIHTRGFWDAPLTVPIRTEARVDGNKWSLDYVNGQTYIDIEIEPRQTNVPVGLQEIHFTPIPLKIRPDDVQPTIYLLGDSTVKSYTFEEAPMCGWGQLFDRFFDSARVHILNYSMGGRSFKNAYFEGRFNDLLNNAHVGDYLFIQFGHNDEMEDEYSRYGRGSTEATYEYYIEHLYIPAIRSRGLVPVFITPMSRVNGDAEADTLYSNSFTNRKFPAIMKRMGEKLGVLVIDLNAKSLDYYNEIGVEATTAIVMSIEAGETPGKTNSGSYANGHPLNRNDGTHFKEALGKQFCRIIIQEFMEKAKSGDELATAIVKYLKPRVKDAADAREWGDIFPEMAKDTVVGEGAYYRNQIEKMLQLGYMFKDADGYFHPEDFITVREYLNSISKVMNVEDLLFKKTYHDAVLTQEVLAAIHANLYSAVFLEKPKYMTDYNGLTVVPGDLHYDPNLDAGNRGAMYYPLVSYEQLRDINEIDPELEPGVQAAYRLGLVRAEKGIKRGKMINGVYLEPKRPITRAKAAKNMYFMWVLAYAVLLKNDGINEWE